MQTDDITTRLDKLQTNLNAQLGYAAGGQIQGDPFALTQLLPMLSDLAGIVRLLHIATDDMSDEISEHVGMLVQLCMQLVKANVLEPQWQGALLTALQPAMLALGIVDDMPAFKEHFQAEIHHLEEWNKQNNNGASAG